MHLRSFDEPEPLAVVPAEPIGEELGDSSRSCRYTAS